MFQRQQLPLPAILASKSAATTLREMAQDCLKELQGSSLYDKLFMLE
jgi:hypothetical protein